MTRTTVSLQGDCHLGGAELTGGVDVTAAIAKADQLCARYGVDTIILPTNSKLLVSIEKAMVDGYIVSLAHAKHFYDANLGSCELVVAPGPRTAEFYVFTTNKDDGVLGFSINGQAARQGVLGHDAGGNLKGWHAGGIKLQGTARTKVHGRYRNLRSISATGDGSVFGVQGVGCSGPEYWVEFITDDGSDGSEAIVNQGVPNGADPWIIHHLRSENMWRGMGCFTGGDGFVYDAIVKNLTGVRDAKAPGGQIKGNAFNIEAGNGTGHITIVDPQSSGSDQFLVVNCNYGETIQQVKVQGGKSVGDGVGIVLAGGAPAGAIDISDWLCDSPRSAVVEGDNALAANLGFTTCTYRLPSGSSAKLLSGSVKARPGWDLTPVSRAPALNSLTPNVWTRGVLTKVRLLGANFAAGCTVSTTRGDIAITNVARVSATEVRATVKPYRTAQVGNAGHSLILTNPDGRATSMPFTVR